MFYTLIEAYFNTHDEDYTLLKGVFGTRKPLRVLKYAFYGCTSIRLANLFIIFTEFPYGCKICTCLLRPQGCKYVFNV